MADHSDASLFVGDLAPEVDDEMLYTFFRQYFGSVKTAKVIVDPTTNRSKGYGFVRFGVESERDRALTELAGAFLASRPLRVSVATAKKPGLPGAAYLGAPTSAAGPTAMGPGASGGGHYSDRSENDPNNTTLFIGGLGAVSEEQLRAIFGRYGDLLYTKVPPGKGCGFVQFVDRTSAEKAMAGMNGQIIGVSPVRVSWGRSTSSKAAAAAAAAAAAGHTPHTHYPSYGHTAHAGYSSAQAGGYYDPAAAAAYGQHYGMYDPYGGQYHAAAYATQGAYAGYTAAYPDPAAQSSVSGVVGAASATPAAATAASKAAAAKDVKGLSVDDQNAAFMARHLPLLSGSYLRKPN